MAQEFKDLDVYPHGALALLNAKNHIAMDTETLGVTYKTNIPFYYSWKGDTLRAGAAPMITQRGFDWAKTLCNSPTRKIFHNMKFDVSVLERAGFEVKGEFEDTILMHMLLDEHHTAQHALKPLSREILKRNRHDEYDMKKYGFGRKNVNNMNIPQNVTHKYATCDADDTYDLFHIFAPKLVELGLWNLYRHEIKVELAYKSLDERGIMVDRPKLLCTLQGVLSTMITLSERVFKSLGKEFKLSSPRQLGMVLKEYFPLTAKTPTGNWSTNKDDLEKFKDQPKMQLILAWRALDSARKNLQGYDKRIREDGRLHPNFRQTTRTGRARCSDPNLMNIPKQRGRISEVEIGDAELAVLCAEAFRMVRAALVAATGAVLLACDYKQIEYRFFAYYSGSRRLRIALMEGINFHKYVCREVFGTFNPQLYYMTKILNYGLLYGMGERLMKTRLSIYLQSCGDSRNPADLLHFYENLLPEMRETQSRCKKQGAALGYVKDPFGRYYHYLEEAPHKLLSYACQGGAANVKKVALVRMVEYFKGHRSGVQLDIHDELVFEMFPEDADMVPGIIEQMQDFDQLGMIPIEVDMTVGKNMLDQFHAVPIQTVIEYVRSAGLMDLTGKVKEDDRKAIKT